MTFDELRTFIYSTRQLEGVAWFFADLSTQEDGQVAEIHGFDGDGQKRVTIINIRPGADGHLPSEILEKIAEARPLCGPCKSFLERHCRKGAPAHMETYQTALEKWLKDTAALFLAGEINPHTA